MQEVNTLDDKNTEKNNEKLLRKYKGEEQHIGKITIIAEQIGIKVIRYKNSIKNTIYGIKGDTIIKCSE